MMCWYPVSKVPSRLTFQNCRLRPQSSVLPFPSPSADPRPPGFHSRLGEGHVLGVLAEEVSRRQVLSQCLQAAVISPGEEAIPTEAGRRKGSSRSPLTHRLDFEIRRAGRSLGEEAWSGYCQTQRIEGQGSREGAGKGRGERRERREKAGRQREGVLG